MPRDKRLARIKELSAQLARSESPEVIAAVARQLQIEISAFFQAARQEPRMTSTPLTAAATTATV